MLSYDHKVSKGGDKMKKEDSDLKELVQILRELDKPSLALIDSGARLLKARMEMDGNKPQKTA